MYAATFVVFLQSSFVALQLSSSRDHSSTLLSFIEISPRSPSLLYSAELASLVRRKVLLAGDMSIDRTCPCLALGKVMAIIESIQICLVLHCRLCWLWGTHVERFSAWKGDDGGKML